ncbi:RsmD family RNA methyltransferase [Candidatus Vidania fulgoroideorum]
MNKKLSILFGNKKKSNIFFCKKVKPTKGIIRNSLFNSIKTMKNKVCLDLFAGSGVLGFEALSLGASKVIFNDINYKNIKNIIKNSKKLNIYSNNNTKFVNSNAFSFIKRNIDKFDVIFIDPPYKISSSLKFNIFLSLCFSRLNFKGLLYLESFHKSNFSNLKNIYPFKERVFNKNKYILFKNNY